MTVTDAPAIIRSEAYLIALVDGFIKSKPEITDEHWQRKQKPVIDAIRELHALYQSVEGWRNGIKVIILRRVIAGTRDRIAHNTLIIASSLSASGALASSLVDRIRERAVLNEQWWMNHMLDVPRRQRVEIIRVLAEQARCFPPIHASDEDQELLLQMVSLTCVRHSTNRSFSRHSTNRSFSRRTHIIPEKAQYCFKALADGTIRHEIHKIKINRAIANIANLDL